MELYKKHRPETLQEIVGNAEVVDMLEGFVARKAIPHAILLTGPSGCGKTTLARILRDCLGCSDMDFAELNCADFRGIDMVRSIREKMMLAPLGGKTRVWLVDECHQLSKDAQNAFLKLLEDTPKHVHFMLATTDPRKLLKTIVTRCTEVGVKELTLKQLWTLVHTVAKDEGIKLTEAVAKSICEAADGSARKALVLLDQVQDQNEEAALGTIKRADVKRQGIEIFRALIDSRTSWGRMAEILRGIDDDPEGLRHLVLACCKTTMLKGGKNASRAYVIADSFRDNFYDTKAAGLVMACYEVVCGSSDDNLR